MFNTHSIEAYDYEYSIKVGNCNIGKNPTKVQGVDTDQRFQHLFLR